MARALKQLFVTCNPEKKAAEEKLELMRKKAKKEKRNARKSREKLNSEIDKLRDELQVPPDWLDREKCCCTVFY